MNCVLSMRQRQEKQVQLTRFNVQDRRHNARILLESMQRRENLFPLTYKDVGHRLHRYHAVPTVLLDEARCDSVHKVERKVPSSEAAGPIHLLEQNDSTDSGCNDTQRLAAMVQPAITGLCSYEEWLSNGCPTADWTSLLYEELYGVESAEKMFYKMRRFALPTEKASFAELIKCLRYRTEAPIMDCTLALKEADGNVEGAIEILHQKRASRVNKKGNRVTDHGFVVSCVGATPANGAAILTLCSETDFAVRSSHFQKTCVLLKKRFEDMLNTSQGKVLDDPEEAARALRDATVDELQAMIAVLGENMRLRSVTPLKVSPHVKDNLFIGTYTHGTLEVDHVGRLVGLVAVSNLMPEAPVSRDVLTAVARHFVATSGAEGNYAHQSFFGSLQEEPIEAWLKRHRLKFSSSLVMEFGKDPIAHMVL